MLGGHAALTDRLSLALVETPPIETSKGGYIAEGYDPSLDALRSASADGRKAIAALVARYGREDLEEVFLDIARGTGAAAAAQGAAPREEVPA